MHGTDGGPSHRGPRATLGPQARRWRRATQALRPDPLPVTKRILDLLRVPTTAYLSARMTGVSFMRNRKLDLRKESYCRSMIGIVRAATRRARSSSVSASRSRPAAFLMPLMLLAVSGNGVHSFHSTHPALRVDSAVQAVGALNAPTPVAVSGATAVVVTHSQSAPIDQPYVFARVGATWRLREALPGFASAPAAPSAVAISGGTIVVGSPIAAPGGRAYVYSRVGATWHLTKTLQGPRGLSNQFGHAVATDGTTVVVSDWTAGATGRAYVYSRVGATWRPEGMLPDPSPVAGGHFGTSVAVSATTAVVGTMSVDGASGRAYVYTKEGPTWRLSGTLQAAPVVPGSQFGHSVAVSGTTVIVGSNDGAYAYDMTPAGWALFTPLQDNLAQGNTPNSNDGFGSSVAVAGAAGGDLTFAVGAPGLTFGSGAPPPGTVHLFSFARAAPTNRGFQLRQSDLSGPGAAASGGFGGSVAISGNTLVVGTAPTLVQLNQPMPAGQAYVYLKRSSGWKETGELSP